MKFIIAIIKPFKLDEVREALGAIGVDGHDGLGGQGLRSAEGPDRDLPRRRILDQHAAQGEARDRRRDALAPQWSRRSSKPPAPDRSATARSSSSTCRPRASAPAKPATTRCEPRLGHGGTHYDAANCSRRRRCSGRVRRRCRRSPRVRQGTCGRADGHRGQQGRHRLDARLPGARPDDDDPRAGAVLRRPRAHQEHAQRADAGVHDRLRRRPVWVLLGLHAGLHQRRGQPLLRRLLEGVPAGRRRHHDAATFSNNVYHPGARLRRLPDDLRDDHSGADRRRLRRAREVRAADDLRRACG